MNKKPGENSEACQRYVAQAGNHEPENSGRKMKDNFT